MSLSSTVNVEAALFNERMVTWEPLIEPTIDSSGAVLSPWCITCSIVPVSWTRRECSSLLSSAAAERWRRGKTDSYSMYRWARSSNSRLIIRLVSTDNRIFRLVFFDLWTTCIDGVRRTWTERRCPFLGIETDRLHSCRSIVEHHSDQDWSGSRSTSLGVIQRCLQ